MSDCAERALNSQLCDQSERKIMILQVRREEEKIVLISPSVFDELEKE